MDLSIKLFYVSIQWPEGELIEDTFPNENKRQPVYI
jgi:hypothetical protein